MSKFTCLILCVVAASLSSVHVTKAESLREAVRPIIEQCSKEHGVTDADIQAAKDSNNANSLPDCFNLCLFEKSGFIGKNGQYDRDTGLTNLSKFLKDVNQYNKVVKASKECESVQEKPAAGCELGTRLVACLFEHQTSIII